uniref:Peroxin-7 n=1 Tax=Malawimonas jakobiformis TaxID=136089 RepID=A0A895KQY4_MALJA|nr:Gsp-co-occurring protein 3 [Malawimonas jakobiformis]
MGVGICLVNNPGSLQWSPFVENQLAVATANRPGHTPISGILYFLNFLPENQIEVDTQVQLNVGTKLLAWSQREHSIVLSSCDDFVLRFFDLKNIDCMFREWFEDEPVNALDWDQISLEWILTAGAGRSVKLYNVLQSENECLTSLDAHDGAVLDAAWNKHSPFHLDSCDDAGSVYLWDVRQSQPALRIRMPEHGCAMKIDRNPYNPHLLAAAGFDSALYLFDDRQPAAPLSVHRDAHYSLITKLRWSPHSEHVLATSSTDRTLRVWDTRPDALAPPPPPPLQQQQQQQQHLSSSTATAGTAAAAAGAASGLEATTIRQAHLKPQKMEDFVTWLDWSVHEVGLLALSSNDQLVKAYNVKEA